MKKGFALITAVIFVVLIATIGILSLSIATSSVKNSSDIYLREEAELLAISAAEHTVLALQAHDFNQNCINTITSKYPDDKQPQYNINVSIRYIGNKLPKECEIAYNGDINIFYNNNLISKYQVAIIDVIVETTENITSEPIRFHRRITQPLNFTDTGIKLEPINRNTP
ncbi:type II secretion system protein [Campylobacter sp. RM12327]|uniref:hypothetical protein n=1 Tax=Campylobacter sputorum TaxID=206 RepID=UPI000B77B6C5|nr:MULTISPECIES: hypothetical protein [Campylobacter]ASM39856.1 hypothetical protein CSPB_0622 [Campylobacter sputorum]MBE7357506.1 type II secretion system protein [Campylobacter sp. RM11302]MBF6669194.1 type II secretion system protein [Campylobacter sp. RM12327]MBF6674331.1 type II secretion system protein [Campylobacter sp. RM13538]MBF6675372.1 type II secretion system protein [Campylobacter sp. RM12321]